MMIYLDAITNQKHGRDKMTNNTTLGFKGLSSEITLALIISFKLLLSVGISCVFSAYLPVRKSFSIY